MRNTLPRLRPIVVLSEPIERAMESMRWRMWIVIAMIRMRRITVASKTSKSSVQAFKKMKKDLNKCGGFSRSNEDSLSQCLERPAPVLRRVKV